MFYTKFQELCAQKGVSVSRAAMEMGLSNSTPTKWKKTGATPDGATLAKVSNYFGVPISYLIGAVDDPADNTKTHWAQVVYHNEIAPIENDERSKNVNRKENEEGGTLCDGSCECTDDLSEYLNVLRDRPEVRMLFSLAKNATKEDVEKAVAIIEVLRRKEQ